MPASDIDTTNQDAKLLAIVEAAKRDIFAYYGYLIENAVDVPAPPKSLSMANDRLIRNYLAIERLTDARNALARLAAPVTATQIRVSQAVVKEKVDTGSPIAPPDIAPTVRRLKTLSRLLWWLSAILVIVIVFGSYFLRVHNGAAQPLRDISFWGINLFDAAQFSLPALCGLLGGTASGTRVFSAALAHSMLDDRTALSIVLNLLLGAIGGTAVASLALDVDWSTMATGFIVGYLAPGVFSRLDDLTAWIFLPKDLQDANRRTGLDLLQPINVTTHFATGTIITLMFLFGCLVAAPRSFLLDSLPTPLEGASFAGIVPVMTILAGALGAWAHVTMDILGAFGEQTTQAEPRRIPLPWIRYLAGGAVGTGVAYILPGSILTNTATLTSFNPFALILLSLFGGYWAARSLKTAISSVDRILGGSSAAVVEEGVRRALTPPPLVNYRGYMQAALLDAADLTSLMVNDTANLRPDVTEFILDLRFHPDKSEDAASAPVLVEGGVNEGDAVFDIEIGADGFEPARRRLRVTTSTGTITRTEQLNYTIQEDKTAEPERAFRLTISQSGRVVQFQVLNVVLLEQP